MRTFRSCFDTATLFPVFIAGACLLAASCDPAQAQRRQLATQFQYSAKALCTL